MNFKLIYLLLFLGGYVLLIVFCEFIYRKKRLEAEYTRKLAHFLATLSTLSFPYFFSYAEVLVLCLFCVIVLFGLKKYEMIKSIDGVKRKTGGSWLLALSAAIIFCIAASMQNFLYYRIAVSTLAVCDPLAGIAGTKIISKTLIHHKTIAGTVTFFTSAFIISALLYPANSYPELFIISFLIALAGTAAELLSIYGTDNISIPLAVIVVLKIFQL